MDRPQRPLSVTLVAVVLVLTACFDAVVAFGLIEGRVVGLGRVIDSAAVTAHPDSEAIFDVLGWVFVGLAITQVVLAVLVARGYNGARLVATLVIATRQAYSWVLLAQFDQQALQGFISLVLSSVILYLLWNRSASTYFGRRDEDAS
jgi:hypothetical protein